MYTDSIAVRVSAHPVVKDLCNAFGAAIPSTSANLSDQPPAKTAMVYDINRHQRNEPPCLNIDA